MRVNSLNLQILLVLSYITAALADGQTINGSYHPYAWFASGRTVMSPIDAVFSTIKGFIINEVQSLVKGKPKTCTSFVLIKPLPALAPNGSDAIYDYAVKVEIKSDNHQYCGMEIKDLQAEMSDVIDILVEKVPLGCCTGTCMKVKGEYGSPITVKLARCDDSSVTLDDPVCCEEQEPDLYLSLHNDGIWH